VSERRYAPTCDEWVTFAAHRQDRTYQPSAEHCPLCPTRDPRFVLAFENKGEVIGVTLAHPHGQIYGYLHWEFAPAHRTADKIKYVAGSELMGGAYMTDIAPEVAAESLRRAIG
jgi:galactose-1-phosphate uridylyltransferase